MDGGVHGMCTRNRKPRAWLLNAGAATREFAGIVASAARSCYHFHQRTLLCAEYMPQRSANRQKYRDVYAEPPAGPNCDKPSTSLQPERLPES